MYKRQFCNKAYKKTFPKFRRAGVELVLLSVYTGRRYVPEGSLFTTSVIVEAIRRFDNGREVIFGVKPRPGKAPRDLEPREIKKLILVLIAGSILRCSFHRGEKRNDIVIKPRLTTENRNCFTAEDEAWAPLSRLLINEDTTDN